MVNTDGHKPCPRIHKFEDWNPHPTSEERIVAKASEYERVSQTLLRHSQELVFVDPYLDLCNQRVEPVVSRLLATVAKGICQKLTFVARARDVLPESGSKSINNLKNEFNRIKNQIKENKSLKMSYLLVNDSYRSKARMHDRFILSAKGGIEFSQGFQELPKMGKITARPIQEIPFKEYCEIYIDVKNNMTIDHDL